MSYAKSTSVSVSRTRLEIEELLRKARADAILCAFQDGRAVVGFAAAGRQVRFELPLPMRDAFATRVVRGCRVKASHEHQEKEWEQACRERWRALLLAIKAKVVSVEAGVESFEQAFYAHIVLPNKQTVYEATSEHLAAAYSSGKMQPLLAAGLV